jgi:hypothetical protein
MLNPVPNFALGYLATFSHFHLFSFIINCGFSKPT